MMGVTAQPLPPNFVVCHLIFIEHQGGTMEGEGLTLKEVSKFISIFL